jgi:hypothetical protein
MNLGFYISFQLVNIHPIVHEILLALFLKNKNTSSALLYIFIPAVGLKASDLLLLQRSREQYPVQILLKY